MLLTCPILCLSHFNICTNYSAELTYHLTQTYNALAELIEWADAVMLMDIKTRLDVSNAKYDKFMYCWHCQGF